MENVTTTRMPGWVQTKFNDFATDDILPATAVDRLQEDSNLLSRAILELHQIYHYPIIATAAHTMSVVASADTVTLVDNLQFAVGGMVFDTHDLDTRAITIPDNATRFLRAEIDDTCGLVVDYGDPANGNIIDPLARKLVCRLSLVEGVETDTEGTGGGQSSPTSLRILKAVKGAAGTTPTVTLYAADGHNPNETSIADHAASDPAHPASHISFDNGTAALPGNPTRVQTAIEALIESIPSVASHEAADPAHAASHISFDNGTANLPGDPTRVQAAIEALLDVMSSNTRQVITASGTWSAPVTGVYQVTCIGGGGGGGAGCGCGSETSDQIGGEGGGAGGTTTFGTISAGGGHGGGGGGSKGGSDIGGAGGGGGSGLVRTAYVSLTAGASVAVQIGAGGTGATTATATTDGAAGSGTSGGAGGLIGRGGQGGGPDGQHGMSAAYCSYPGVGGNGGCNGTGYGSGGGGGASDCTSAPTATATGGLAGENGSPGGPTVSQYSGGYGGNGGPGAVIVEYNNPVN